MAPVTYVGSQVGGRIRAVNHRPTPEPQQPRIQAMSVTHTIAHSNVRSLTHWTRPGRDWTLVLMDTSWVCYHWATIGIPFLIQYVLTTGEINVDLSLPFFFFFFLAVQKLLDQGLNPYHSTVLSHNSDNAESFTARPWSLLKAETTRFPHCKVTHSLCNLFNKTFMRKYLRLSKYPSHHAFLPTL